MNELTGTIVERVFKFGDKTFTDPDPSLSVVMAVKKIAEKDPEVINAELSAPKHEEGRLVYNLTKAAGIKG